MAKLTQEQLERVIENIEKKYQVLEEEYWVVKNKIRHKDYTEQNLVELIERLRDNLKSRQSLEEELRNAYKDSLELQNTWM